MTGGHGGGENSNQFNIILYVTCCIRYCSSLPVCSVCQNQVSRVRDSFPVSRVTAISTVSGVYKFYPAGQILTFRNLVRLI